MPSFAHRGQSWDWFAASGIGGETERLGTRGPFERVRKSLEWMCILWG